uniref:Protein arginine methyltransferase 6 n=1 Tax=Molossus molossus TaxID=27622 RepID=A0A7J8CT65_MOLMO|nr:protein arginine methyltransferase 6 [Molossus molossus]
MLEPRLGFWNQEKQLCGVDMSCLGASPRAASWAPGESGAGPVREDVRPAQCFARLDLARGRSRSWRRGGRTLPPQLLGLGPCRLPIWFQVSFPGGTRGNPGAVHLAFSPGHALEASSPLPEGAPCKWSKIQTFPEREAATLPGQPPPPARAAVLQSGRPGGKDQRLCHGGLSGTCSPCCLLRLPDLHG